MYPAVPSREAAFAERTLTPGARGSMAVTSGRGPGERPGRSGGNPELYRRRPAARPDPELRWLATCPVCGRAVNSRSRDIVQTVLAGHHYYNHGLRLTQAEMDAATDELIPEQEIEATKNPAGDTPAHMELPLK